MPMMRLLRSGAVAGALAIVAVACGGDDEPDAAEAAADEEEVAEPAADEAPTEEADDEPVDAGEEDSGDLDVTAWCELADSGVILLRYDDPGLLAEHIDVLERMAALTSGEMRANHDAGVALRREVLAVVEDLTDPGMDEMERREVVEGHERITTITQAPAAMQSEAALMGYHLDHCF